MKNAMLNLLFLLINAKGPIGRFGGILFTISYSVVAVPIVLAVYCGTNSRLFFAMLHQAVSSEISRDCYSNGGSFYGAFKDSEEGIEINIAN